jgi:pimeloyl-ACP methyl ester carboxylesterase
MTDSSFWVEALGAQTRFYEADGLQTRCIEAGTGEPVILLHGFGGHAETWIRNVGRLSDEFHVYALDMLGHGLTAKPDIDYSVESLARHVLAFMDAVGAPKAALVGQSLGGWVAGWLAVNEPDRVSAFASVTGGGFQVSADGAESTRRVGTQVRDATVRAFEQPTRENVRQRLEWLLHDTSLVTEELVEVRFRIYSDPAFTRIAPRLLDGLTVGTSAENALTRDRLQQIECPTLVLWTRYNPTTPWEEGREASEVIPGASFYLMEEAGHWPQFEKPDEFHDVLLEFLARVPTVSAAGTS